MSDPLTIVMPLTDLFTSRDGLLGVDGADPGSPQRVTRANLPGPGDHFGLGIEVR
jgi:hypothetical protein